MLEAAQLLMKPQRDGIQRHHVGTEVPSPWHRALFCEIFLTECRRPSRRLSLTQQGQIENAAKGRGPG
jgi:hypothetical protein